MRTRATVLAVTLTGMVVVPGVEAGRYSLFDPVPEGELRDLAPDRPDATESAVTLDAGWWAVEASVFDWRREGAGGDEVWTLMSTNVKVGLGERTDAQVVFDAYAWEEPGSGDREEGFGDVQFRLKRNLWGNDGGRTALAVFPFVSVPTGARLSSGEWEGGVIVPFSVELSDRVGLGLMAEGDVVYDEDEGGHRFEFLHSAVLGFDLGGVVGGLGAFAEYIGIAGEGSYRPVVSGGFTYAVSRDFVLDCGGRVGFGEASGDGAVFFGFTRRF